MFRVGQQVRCVDPNFSLIRNQHYIIVEVNQDIQQGRNFVKVVTLEGNLINEAFFAHRFIAVEEALPQPPQQAEEQNSYSFYLVLGRSIQNRNKIARWHFDIDNKNGAEEIKNRLINADRYVTSKKITIKY